MREQYIQTKILNYLKSKGIVCVKTITLSENGYPDITGVIPPTGRALWIEVKRPGNKPTKLQLYRLEQLKSAGALAFWADNLDEVKRQLEIIHVN